MERFINGKIDGTQLDSEFYWMERVNYNKKYSWKNLLNKPTNVALTKWEVFEPDPALRDDYQISKEEFKNCVKKTVLKIQDYLDKEFWLIDQSSNSIFNFDKIWCVRYFHIWLDDLSVENDCILMLFHNTSLNIFFRSFAIEILFE